MTAGKALRLALLLTATLQLTALTDGLSNMAVTAGQEVTLICEGYSTLYGDCSSTTWLFSAPAVNTAVTLYENGRFRSDAKTKSVRLSVTANCSLLIKEVKLEDAGRYDCRQFHKSGKHISDSVVQLSVSEGVETTTKTTTKDKKPTTKDKKTTKANKQQTKATTTITIAPTKPTPAGITTTSTTKPSTFPTDFPLLPVLAGVAAAALLIAVVLIIVCKKTKGKRTKMEDKNDIILNLTEVQSGPDGGQDTADPADAVPYASIDYNKMAANRAGMKRREEDSVTYSTVKAPPADPCELYSTVQKNR